MYGNLTTGGLTTRDLSRSTSLPGTDILVPIKVTKFLAFEALDVFVRWSDCFVMRRTPLLYQTGLEDVDETRRVKEA